MRLRLDPTDLKDLAARRLVAIIAHVVTVVGGRWPQAENVAENANNSQQTFHLSFITTGEAEQEKEVTGVMSNTSQHRRTIHL